MKTERVTLGELAKRSGYSRQSITSWTATGLLRRQNGTYPLVESLESIRTHETDRATEGSTDLKELRGLRRQLLEKKLEKIDHELSVAKGLVHSKALCCQSIMALRAAESRTLSSVAARVASKYPEVPGLKQAIEAESDGVIARLHDGSAYDVNFHCPHCHERVEQLVAEEKPTKGE